MHPVITELDAALGGPRRAKRRLLAEAADGLDDAVDAYCRGGVPRARALALAAADFGDPALLRPHYQDELDRAATRRSALVHLAVGPLLLAGWWLVWNLNPHHPFSVSPAAITAGVFTGLCTLGGCAVAMRVLLMRSHQVRGAAALRSCTRWELAGVAMGMLGGLVLLPLQMSVPLLMLGIALHLMRRWLVQLVPGSPK